MSTPSTSNATPAPDKAAPPRVQGAGLGEVHFDFGRDESHFGRSFWVSVGVHGLFVAAIVLIGAMLPKEVYRAVIREDLPSLVFVPAEGPGGGGGGGGNTSPEPPKQSPTIEVPAKKPAAPVPDPPKEVPPPPPQEITAPVETVPTPDPAPAIVASAAPSPSQGTGTAGGAGTGSGTGIGSGQGSGIGQGTGGGIGGGAYMPGNGVTSPMLLHEVKPQYTAEAMRAKVQGTVRLQCVVLPDGTVGDVQVTKSLDATFGLDQQAIKAAKQWRFRPGTRMGEPVPVLVLIELDFNLR